MKPSINSTPTDERLVRCAEHNTAFYASFPRAWSVPQALRALHAHFVAHGHQHMPFETVDLVPARVAAIARPAARRAA